MSPVKMRAGCKPWAAESSNNQRVLRNKQQPLYLLSYEPHWLFTSSSLCLTCPLSVCPTHPAFPTTSPSLSILPYPFCHTPPSSRPYRPRPLTPPSLLQVCEVDRRHSFRRSALVCHDVIAVATRQTVSRYAQTHQAPDPNPDTHTHTHLRGLSAAFDHLRPLVLSETLMPGLRSLTYFHTHTHTHRSSFPCVLPYLLHAVTLYCVRVCVFKWQLYVCV